MANDKPYNARFEAQTVARIHVVTPRQEIQSAMMIAMGELSAALEAAGLSRTGPWFAHFHRRPSDTFDFDVCYPINKAIPYTGKVENAEIPATDVIRTVHHGDYAKLPQAWHDFVDWVSANGIQTREDGFEVYTVGPNENQDPDCWRTELNIPLATDEVNQQTTQTA